jgi:hypothetical protein
MTAFSPLTKEGLPFDPSKRLSKCIYVLRPKYETITFPNGVPHSQHRDVKPPLINMVSPFKNGGATTTPFANW